MTYEELVTAMKEFVIDSINIDLLRWELDNISDELRPARDALKDNYVFDERLFNKCLARVISNVRDELDPNINYKGALVITTPCKKRERSNLFSTVGKKLCYPSGSDLFSSGQFCGAVETHMTDDSKKRYYPEGYEEKQEEFGEGFGYYPWDLEVIEILEEE